MSGASGAMGAVRGCVVAMWVDGMMAKGEL